MKAQALVYLGGGTVAVVAGVWADVLGWMAVGMVFLAVGIVAVLIGAIAQGVRVGIRDADLERRNRWLDHARSAPPSPVPPDNPTPR